MVQAYNNWYDGIQGGTLSYLQDVYLNWINAKSPFCLGCQVIPNFKGVPPSKLAIGVLGSTSAGNSGYFATGLVIDSFQEWLSNNTYSVAGFMIWDSHWDSSNGFNISNSVLTSYNSTPLTPPTPAPIVCLI
jgi:chitinase